MTAHELLKSAPDGQVARCKIVYRNIINGQWADAIYHLENAVLEEGDSPWGLDAADLLCQCRMHAA